MLRKEYIISSIALLFSLFIYLFLRPPQTIISYIFSILVSESMLHDARDFIESYLYIPDLFIYSLPGGLWVFACTILSKDIKIRVGSVPISLVHAPLAICVLIELLQLLKISNGVFDPTDLILAFFAWIIGILYNNVTSKEKQIKRLAKVDLSICAICYVSIYLAHALQ